MKQIVKRILTFALSAAMVLTLVPTTAFAEDTGSNNVNKNLRVSGTSENVEVNKTYIVPVERLDKYGLNIDWTATGEDKEWGQDNVAQKALVTPKEDGTYSVTLQWALYDYLDAVQFYKQDKMTDELQPKDLTMGTFNVPDKFKIDFSSATAAATKKFDYT